MSNCRFLDSSGYGIAARTDANACESQHALVGTEQGTVLRYGRTR